MGGGGGRGWGGKIPTCVGSEEEEKPLGAIEGAGERRESQGEKFQAGDVISGKRGMKMYFRARST